MQYAFILKNGSEKQKADAGNEESWVKIEGIYKEVMSGVLSKLAGGLKITTKILLEGRRYHRV
jgi:hypothetical protein